MACLQSILNPAPPTPGAPRVPPTAAAPASAPAPSPAPALQMPSAPTAGYSSWKTSPAATTRATPKEGLRVTGRRPKGDVNFPPFENLDETALESTRRYNIFPEVGMLYNNCHYVPYNSEKRDFFKVTGREGFEVFHYTYWIPGNPEKWDVLWDYNIGLVRTTPFFKSLGYTKTAPNKMIAANEGLKRISHSITGGSTEAQGYWMPYSCARAVAATFCHDIAGALIPLFGPRFPSECIPPHDPRYKKWAIDPTIIKAAERQTEELRQKYGSAVRQGAGGHHHNHHNACLQHQQHQGYPPNQRMSHRRSNSDTFNPCAVPRSVRHHEPGGHDVDHRAARYQTRGGRGVNRDRNDRVGGGDGDAERESSFAMASNTAVELRPPPSSSHEATQQQSQDYILSARLPPPPPPLPPPPSIHAHPTAYQHPLPMNHHHYEHGQYYPPEGMPSTYSSSPHVPHRDVLMSPNHHPDPWTHHYQSYQQQQQQEDYSPSYHHHHHYQQQQHQYQQQQQTYYQEDQQQQQQQQQNRPQLIHHHHHTLLPLLPPPSTILPPPFPSQGVGISHPPQSTTDPRGYCLSRRSRSRTTTPAATATATATATTAAAVPLPGLYTHNPEAGVGAEVDNSLYLDRGGIEWRPNNNSDSDDGGNSSQNEDEDEGEVEVEVEEMGDSSMTATPSTTKEGDVGGRQNGNEHGQGLVENANASASATAQQDAMLLLGLRGQEDEGNENRNGDRVRSRNQRGGESSSSSSSSPVIGRQSGDKHRRKRRRARSVV